MQISSRVKPGDKLFLLGEEKTGLPRAISSAAGRLATARSLRSESEQREVQGQRGGDGAGGSSLNSPNPQTLCSDRLQAVT